MFLLNLKHFQDNLTEKSDLILKVFTVTFLIDYKWPLKFVYLPAY
jgi:hypothetical protein